MVLSLIQKLILGLSFACGILPLEVVSGLSEWRCPGVRGVGQQPGCFLGLERALGLGSSFWLQNWLHRLLPGQLWTSQLIFLSVVSLSAKGGN